MRSRLTRRAPRKQLPPKEIIPEELINDDDPLPIEAVGNGADLHSDPPIPSPPQPSPAELVQAVLRVIQRVDALERAVGGLAQHDSVQRDALERNTRNSAVTTAARIFELLYPKGVRDFAGNQEQATATIDTFTAHYLNYFKG